MHPVRHRTRASLPWLVLVVACLPLVFSSAQDPPAPGPSDAVLIAFSSADGVRLSRRGADWDRSYTNLVLHPGDRIRTDENSWALLRFSDLETLRLGSRSQVLIQAQENSPRGVQLLKGILYFFHRGPADSFGTRGSRLAAIVRGTEFVFEVDEDKEQLSLLDGEVLIRTDRGGTNLVSGEQAVLARGEPLRKTAMLAAINTIQWCLYYPAVLDPEELRLDPAAEQALGPSLAAYREGDLPRALALHSSAPPPRSADERSYLAALKLSAGELAQAAALLRPEAPALPETRPFGYALQTLITAVQHAPSRPARPDGEPGPWTSSTSASVLLAESYFAQSRSDLEAARTAARAAVERSPRFGFGWARLAELEFSFGRLADAERAVQKALSLAPRHAPAVALQGFLLAARQRTPEALRTFERAIALDGALGNGWLGRGLCRIKLGDTAAGRNDLQVAATLEPNRSVLRSYLGKAFVQAGDEAHGRRELELAKGLDPGDPTPWLYSALLLQEQNRPLEAVDELRRSRELNDNRSVYRSRLLLDEDRSVRAVNLAGIYQEAGLAEVSLREAASALQSDYANFSAHLFAAGAYGALRDPRQVNLRYESAWLREYLVANLLAPAGAGALSPYVSQEEYSRFFERNRLGLNSSTEYYSSGDWVQTASQYGLYENLAYTLDAVYRSENGHRPNNDLELFTSTLRLKEQLSTRDSVYLEASWYEAAGGDVSPYYNEGAEASRSVRIRESQRPLLLAGYHREWAPGVHTLLLAGHLDDRYQVRDPMKPTLAIVPDEFTGATNDVGRAEVRQRYAGELGIFTAELQQLVQRQNHTVVLGAGYQGGELPVTSRETNGFLFRSILPEKIEPDFQRWSAYGYWQWQIISPLALTAGLSYDSLRFPANHRSAPLVEEEETRRQWSPKAGAIWRPTSGTTLRAGYAQAMGGVSFEQSARLEPTQVGGFNQAFRSVIPEAVVGTQVAPRFEMLSVGVEQELGRGTYANLYAERLQSDLDRRLGAYLYDPSGFAYRPGGLRERLDFTEQSLAASFYQLFAPEWTLGARYRISDATLRDRFPELPAGFTGTDGTFRARREVEAVLQQLRFLALYHRPDGFFAQADAVWSVQHNEGYAGLRPGDDFWQFNVQVGYRFPARRAEVRAGLLNLTDRNYRLNPLNLTSELPRERTIFVSLRFSF